MQVEKYNRKPFSVLAVQVNFENVAEVAEWCNGTVIKQQVRMMGVDTDVPAIRVDGQGDNRGTTFVATLGCYVVELNGNFRVYKPTSFASTFEKDVESLVKDACAVCASEEEHKTHVRYMTGQAYVSLLDLAKNATPETKAEWSEGDMSNMTPPAERL